MVARTSSRSRTRIGQGSLIASLLWEDAASHAGASRRLWFDWSPTAAYQILTWQTGLAGPTSNGACETCCCASSCGELWTRAVSCSRNQGNSSADSGAAPQINIIWPSPPKVAGAGCAVCRVAAGCQEDLERCISRAGNSNE